ncbi:unnamed protein product [Symbiodinium sp. CCMP2592]|nr:unnamed protein product [Symbiodinium sp. CCMP2592]
MSGLSVTVDEALSLVKVPLRGFYSAGVVQSVFKFWCADITDEDDLVPAEKLQTFVASCKALQCPEERARHRCAACAYPVHEEPAFGGFCCRLCHESWKKGSRTRHGKKCQAWDIRGDDRLLRVAALPVPPLPPLEETPRPSTAKRPVENLAGSSSSLTVSAQGSALYVDSAPPQTQHLGDGAEGLSWENFVFWARRTTGAGSDPVLCIVHCNEEPLKGVFGSARAWASSFFGKEAVSHHDMVHERWCGLREAIEQACPYTSAWSGIFIYEVVAEGFVGLGIGRTMEFRTRAALVALSVAACCGGKEYGQDPDLEQLIQVANRKQCLDLPGPSAKRKVEEEPNTKLINYLQKISELHSQELEALKQLLSDKSSSETSAGEALKASATLEAPSSSGGGSSSSSQGSSHSATPITPSGPQHASRDYLRPTPKYRSQPLQTRRTPLVPKEPSTPPPGWKPTPKEPPTPPPGWQGPVPPAEVAPAAPSFLLGAREALEFLVERRRRVPVDRIQFTQDTCADVFSDGRRCEDTFQKVVRGHISLDAEFLELECVETSSGEVKSFNNRRLRLWKRLQQRSSTQLMVTCKVRTMDPDFESCLEQVYELQDRECFHQQKELMMKVLFHRDSEYRGDIRVRHSKRRHNCWWS